MEDKIEVGEYVRTKKGDIDKIDRYIFESNIYHCENGMCIDTENRIGLHLEDIVKHSKNIIDLIEVGDIVEFIDVLNEEVIYIWDEEMLEAVKQDIEEGQILKSILTREEFMNRKYEV